jgi:hypothetical protein
VRSRFRAAALGRLLDDVRRARRLGEAARRRSATSISATGTRPVRRPFETVLSARVHACAVGCRLMAREPAYHSSARARSVDRQDFERRVLAGDRVDLCVAGIWSDAVEEHADLDLPPLQVGAQHRHLPLVGQLATAECLRALADLQLALSVVSMNASPHRVSSTAASRE